MTAELFSIASSTISPAKKTKPQKRTLVYTQEFNEKLWGPYPRKLNCSKLDAFKAWLKLPEDEQQQAIAAVQVFARSMAGKDERFIPHCSSWLNGKYFETVAVAPTVVLAPTSFDWPTIIRLWKATNRWNTGVYGPEPFTNGCKVPPEYLS